MMFIQLTRTYDYFELKMAIWESISINDASKMRTVSRSFRKEVASS